MTQTSDVYCYSELGSYFNSHDTEFPQFICVLETKYKHVYILQFMQSYRNLSDYNSISALQHSLSPATSPHNFYIYFIVMQFKSSSTTGKSRTETIPLVGRNFVERSIHLVFLWSIQDQVDTGLVSPPASEATVFESVLLTHTSSILSPHG